MEQRVDALEDRVAKLDRSVMEMQATVQKSHELLASINKALTGDMSDGNRPGLLIRIDRLEQEASRRQKRESALWGVTGSLIVGVILLTLKALM